MTGPSRLGTTVSDPGVLTAAIRSRTRTTYPFENTQLTPGELLLVLTFYTDALLSINQIEETDAECPGYKRLFELCTS